RILALGEAVDLIVEEQDLEIDVAAQHMDQMVAADRQTVAVARYHPYVKLGPRDFQPGRDRRCAAVNRMEAVSVHVIRKTARTSDARDEDRVLARHPQLRHYLLHLGQDCVVTASGAPTHFLVGNEILAGQSGSHFSQPSSARRMRLVSSLTLNGRPWILLQPTASTR